MRVLPSFSTHTLSEYDVTAPGPWAQALAQPAFRGRAALVVLLLVAVVGVALPPYFVYVQQRPGQLLADPLLALLPCRQVAVPIFVLMYGACVAGLGWLGRHPALLLRGLWAYLLLAVLRMATIWALPLLPPADLIAMPDPFLALVYHTEASEAMTKDLFFSGHTSTVVLLALAVRGRWWRTGLAVAAVLVGLLVLVQRVHYSYDVLAAPFFAWLAYWAAGFITRAVAAPGGW
ncbi:MAG TPA: phosphatase PAP2-related protein [Hymenobacter sp.]|uniref:phosphatase PAP2-related protein n=1 Tax=Hymenobacter sp. TaxID=1898978 RepID=UPI002D7EB5ED|nr:phosphatase PAP2-related protein [Hymenobacter sp.]HET9503486.1 phosphatase PAP2-related protein [Hymenobacter sp.]